MQRHAVSRAFLLAGAVALLAGPALAAVYDLSADWSTSSNPNGPWAYGDSAGTLTTLQTDYASLIYGPGLSAWATTANGTGLIASWMKMGPTPDVTAAIQYLAGDVISGPWDANVGAPGRGPSSVVRWTAPAATTIDITGFTWHAHVNAFEAQNWALSVDGVTQASGVVTDSLANGRSNPDSFGLTGIAVDMGDVVAFSFTPSVFYANWVGLSLTITTDVAVAEPATLAVLGAAILSLAAARRRRPG